MIEKEACSIPCKVTGMAILQRILIKSDMAASLCFPVPPAPPAERCRHRRGAVPQGFKAADGSPCPERRILMNGGQSGNAFPACQCICNTQSPDALFAPPPCLRYIRQSIFAKQPETHYAGNDKAAVQKAEKENRNSAFTPAPAATYVCYTLLGKRR